MRKKLLVIIVIFGLSQNISFGCPRTFFHDCFTIPYILWGDIHYHSQKYDSALHSYLIPYKLFFEENRGYKKKTSQNCNLECLTGKVESELILKIGKTFSHLGDYNNSIKYLDKLIKNDCFRNNAELKGNTHYYLGMSYNKTFDYSNSLLHYLKSLEYYSIERSDSSKIIGLIYLDIGNVHYNNKNYEKAIEYYNLSYIILCNQKEPDFSKLSIIKSNIGSIHFRHQETKEAIIYLKSAISLSAKGNISYYDHSMYLNNLAGIYLSIGYPDSAELYYKKSLFIREHFLQNNILLVQTHNQLGVLYLFTSRINNSLDHFQQALILNSVNFNDSLAYSNPSVHDVKDYMQYGTSLYFKAIAFNKLFQQNGSLNSMYLHESLKLIDLLISYFAHIYTTEQSQEILLSYIAFNRDVINVAFDIYSENNVEDDNKWFSIFQQGKSILLYQKFLESKAKIFANIPHDLLEKEKSIRNKIFDYDKRVESALNNGMEFTDSDDFILLISSRNKRISQLDSLIAIFEIDYPQYYKIKYDFKPRPLEDIREQLSEEEVILEYHLTDSTIYSACVSKQHFLINTEHADSATDVINSHLRSIKFYNEELFIRTATYLYDKLIGHFDTMFRNSKKIIIIPDKELSMFPFETLVKNIEPGSDKYKYLIEDFEINYHFSTSLWFESKSLPFYKDKHSLMACAPIYFNSKDSTQIQLSPLEYTRQETSMLEQLFQSNGLNTLCLLEFDATKETFLENLSYYSIIHLATHHTYYFDKSNSSGIVFSPNNRESTTRGSNVLNTREAYNLDLNADLVVLSACMTGLGNKLKGEGTITLYRGFFYSGARNIVFTLWNAPDRYTYRFMMAFYNSLFEGNSYSCSIRNAKLSFLNDEKTNLPVFWSNYLILGN